MSYVRLDPEFFDNAKVAAAGMDGAAVFLEALALNERGSRDGTLTLPESQPRHLCRHFRSAWDWDDTRCAQAVKAAVAADLLEALPDGRLKVAGWDDQWRPPLTEKERAKSYRNRRKMAASQPASHQPSQPASRIESHPSPSVRPTDRPSNRPSSGGGPGEDGPDQDHIPEQPLKDLGMVDPKAIAKARATLALFDKPQEVLQVLERHVRRFGKNPPALLAKVLADPDHVRQLLQEAADKAENEALRFKIRTLIASLAAKSRTA